MIGYSIEIKTKLQENLAQDNDRVGIGAAKKNIKRYAVLASVITREQPLFT